MNLLGERPLSFVAREAVRPANWVALARMTRRYPRFAESAKRYFTSRGAYPYRCEVRTPAGIVAPTLFSQHDMITLNEVFCREDYRVGSEAQVVVDLGSNIGVSALYFLTRSPASRVWLYEPLPENIERLRGNLEAFEGRWRVEQVAVADRRGRRASPSSPPGDTEGWAALTPSRSRSASVTSTTSSPRCSSPSSGSTCSRSTRRERRRASSGPRPASCSSGRP